MRKFATRNEYIAGVIIALFVLVGTAYAVTKSFRADGGVRMLGSATPGTTGTAANPVVWSDNTTKPNLRFGDGTSNEYVAACAVTTNGDICQWNGTNWIRSTGSGVTFPISNGSSSVTFNYGGTQTGSTLDYSSRATNAATVGDKLWSWGDTAEIMSLKQSFSGIWDLTSANANIGLISSNNDGVRVQGSGLIYFYIGGAANWQVTANDISPNSAASPSLGGTTSMTTVRSKIFQTFPQANTMGATVTINPATASYAKQTYTSATNVTTMTISAGVEGQELIVQLLQPAAGTAATMVTSWTNVSFAGTASFTATLGKNDIYTFVYNATTSKWYERSRSLNLTN